MPMLWVLIVFDVVAVIYK